MFLSGSPRRVHSRQHVVRHMMRRILGRPTSGSTGISVVKLGEFAPIVLVGEIHDNPDLCRGHAAKDAKKNHNDVLRDLVVYPLLHHPRTVLFLEGFVNTGETTLETLEKELERYDVRHMTQCFNTNFGRRCQYKGRTPGVLNFLRWLKTSLQLQALRAPHDSAAQRENERIVLFDIRHALGMQTPFVDWSMVKDSGAYIRQSLEKVEAMADFMQKIPHATWHDVFHRHVYLEVLERVEALRRTPTTKEYEDFFIKFPDLIALNHLLVHIAQDPAQCLPIVYGGENHRQHLLHLLSKFGPVKILAEAQDSNTMGSCAVPLI